MRRRTPAIATVVLLSSFLITTGCRPAAAPSLRPLCRSVPLAATITLHLDSVRAEAGKALVTRRGDSLQLALDFAVLEEPGPCPGRGGVVRVTSTPAALASVLQPGQAGQWRVQQDSGAAATVSVDLTPKMRDNNLGLVFPMDSTVGSWSWSTFVGPVARGRAVITKAERSQN